jgi:hypothetical protein
MVATLAPEPQYFLVMGISQLSIIYFAVHSLHFAEYLLQ